MSFYREQLEDYLKELDIKANRVLDIGGASNPVKDRVKSWDVKDYKIADNCLEDNKVKVDFEIDLNDPLFYEVGRQYDLIFCLEVFEYIYNPTMALESIWNFLNNGGRAIITFPFVYPMHNPKEYDCLRYTPYGVKKLCKETGLIITKEIYRYDQSGLLEQYFKTDGQHPAKRIRHDITGIIIEVKK